MHTYNNIYIYLQYATHVILKQIFIISKSRGDKGYFDLIKESPLNNRPVSFLGTYCIRVTNLG